MVVPTQTSSSSCWALLWCCYQTRTGMMGKDEVREADLNMPWYTRCACFLLLSKFGRSTTPEQAWLQLLLEGGGESKNKNLLANWNEQLDIKNSCVWCYFAHVSIKVIITSLKFFFFILFGFHTFVRQIFSLFTELSLDWTHSLFLLSSCFKCIRILSLGFFS